MWAQHMQNVSERQSHFLHHLHLQLLPYVSKVLMTTQSAPTNALLRFNWCHKSKATERDFWICHSSM